MSNLTTDVTQSNAYAVSSRHNHSYVSHQTMYNFIHEPITFKRNNTVTPQNCEILSWTVPDYSYEYKNLPVSEKSKKFILKQLLSYHCS